MVVEDWGPVLLVWRPWRWLATKAKTWAESQTCLSSSPANYLTWDRPLSLFGSSFFLPPPLLLGLCWSRPVLSVLLPRTCSKLVILRLQGCYSYLVFFSSLLGLPAFDPNSCCTLASRSAAPGPLPLDVGVFPLHIPSSSVTWFPPEPVPSPYSLHRNPPLLGSVHHHSVHPECDTDQDPKVLGACTAFDPCPA